MKYHLSLFLDFAVASYYKMPIHVTQISHPWSASKEIQL